MFWKRKRGTRLASPFFLLSKKEKGPLKKTKGKGGKEKMQSFPFLAALFPKKEERKPQSSGLETSHCL